MIDSILAVYGINFTCRADSFKTGSYLTMNGNANKYKNDTKEIQYMMMGAGLGGAIGSLSGSASSEEREKIANLRKQAEDVRNGTAPTAAATGAPANISISDIGNTQTGGTQFKGNNTGTINNCVGSDGSAIACGKGATASNININDQTEDTSSIK